MAGPRQTSLPSHAYQGTMRDLSIMTVKDTQEYFEKRLAECTPKQIELLKEWQVSMCRPAYLEGREPSLAIVLSSVDLFPESDQAKQFFDAA